MGNPWGGTQDISTAARCRWPVIVLVGGEVQSDTVLEYTMVTGRGGISGGDTVNRRPQKNNRNNKNK